MLKSDAAAFLAGVKQVEGAAASAPTNLHVITGEVGTTSEDGKTTISIDGLVFSEEDSQEIEIDTLGGLEEGDIATVILTGESGHGMTPLAIGGVGSVDRLKARVVDAELLLADKADIDDLEAATARIGNLEADHVSVDTLEAATARIETLEVDHVSIADFEVEQANVDNLQAATADIDTIRANSAKVQNLTAAQLEADHATIGTLDTTYMHADMANADVAWIQNGTIKEGSIVSAMINDVSANKLTAGTINGSVINVTNLNADNITTGTINGQRIGEGSLSLSKLEDDVYTETEVNNIVDGLNDRIDGAIQTYTGTAVPTLNNSPASSWNTTALKDEHVGDVYYVVDSQSQQNGYCYRFTKSGSTYSWQLIKDSDVTAALSRLTTAEGKITTFDSDISQLRTDTGTLTTKTESLETRMSDAEEDILDKVDTTTFNEVSDTVDQHSQTISQHTTAISNKADSSTVTAVTNRVSKNEQDISGINTTIGTLQETVESKADGSTVTTISNRLNTVSDTVDGHTSQLSSITSTQTTMQSTLDKTVKSSIQLWYSKANTTAPSKPTSEVTSTSTSGNAWRIVVPAYSSSYPHYYYCWQYEYTDGTYGWSAVVRDIAMGESQSTARTADSNASAAVTTATNAQNMANANIKSSVQLWFTKANSTAPNKPTSVVSTSNANTANAWNLVVPVWNKDYPHYFYCYQQQKGDGNYQWTDVVYDRATSEAQQLANTTSTNLSTLQTDYATFKQTTEQFESTVGTTYATKTELNGATDDITELEGRVSTNETSISNNASAIALKANSSDVYTKTAVDGKITQEVSDRNAAITAKANEITSSVSETYATKSSVNGKADASDVTALAGRVTTAESNITQNANNIALKVSESDVTGNYLVGKINLDSTTASIAAQRINLQGAVTISDLASDAQNATLNSNISVGGRNLLYNTGDFAGWLVSGNYAGSATDGIWTFPAPSSLNWSSVISPFPALALSDYDGETLTLSFDYRSDDFGDTSGNHYVYIVVRGQDSAYANTRTKYRQISTPIFNGVFVPTTEWQRGSITFTMSESLFTSGSGVVTHFCIQFYNNTLNSYQLRHVKLEKGNKITDWSPAPEDVDSAISNAAKTATSYVTDITGGGIMVHPSGNQNTGAQITDRVNIMQNGVSVAEYSETARVGAENSTHSVWESGAFIFNDGTNDTMKLSASESITETHTISSDYNVSYNAYIELEYPPASLISVEVDNTDYTYTPTMTPYGLKLWKHEAAFDGETVTVTYKPVPGLYIYDGSSGDDASNLVARINANHVSLAKDMFSISTEYDLASGSIVGGDIRIGDSEESCSEIKLRSSSDRSYLTIQTISANGAAAFVLDSGSTSYPERVLDLIYLDRINYADPYGGSDRQLGKPQRLTASGSYKADTSNTMGPAVTLSAGLWFVEGIWAFTNSSSSSKTLTVGLLRSSNGSSTWRTHTTASSNQAHRLEVVDTFLVNGTSDTLTLYASSSPASTSASTQYIIAIRLA